MGASLDQVWQEIDAECLSCHSWQEMNERMITAMTGILLLAALFVLLVRYARHDVFATRRTPWPDDLARP
jgi:heme A synthase